ncbi:MAG: NUDIX domain-containing protein [Caulobacteraceae bacterium]|nr:NUDIX domain-containing protein [Caulobacteraceae bacterium]
MQVRPTVRVLLLDPEDRLLLFRGRLPAQPDSAPFWFTCGGGIEPGETVEDAALREISRRPASPSSTSAPRCGAARASCRGSTLGTRPGSSRKPSSSPAARAATSCATAGRSSSTASWTTPAGGPWRRSPPRRRPSIPRASPVCCLRCSPDAGRASRSPSPGSRE